MDARDIIADSACRQDWNKYETANYILQRLTAAGFTVIHDSENHGPTMDRAAQVVETGYWSRALEGSVGLSVGVAIRAMGEKK